MPDPALSPSDHPMQPELGDGPARRSHVKVYDRPGPLAFLTARPLALILVALLTVLISSVLVYTYAV